MERSGHDAGSKASSRRSGLTTTTTTTTTTSTANTLTTTSRAGRTSDNSASKTRHHDSIAQRSQPPARTQAQSQGLGPQVTQSPAFSLVNLKDVVSATQAAKGASKPSGGSHQGRGGSRPHPQDRKDSSSTKAGARRDRSEQRRQGGGARSSSEDPASNKKASKSSSQPPSAADRSNKPSSKAQTPTSTSSSQADAESKSKSKSKDANSSSNNNSSGSSSNPRAKGGGKNSAESQDTGKGGRSPGRLKKSLSAGGESGGKGDMYGVQPQSSSGKSTPRAKKKMARGRSVHDSSEFGEVKEVPDNDVSRTLKRKPSPTRDVGGGSRSKEQANNVQPKPTAKATTTTTATTATAETNQRTSQTALQPLPPSSAPSISPLPPAAPSKPSAFHVQLVPELSQQSSFFSLNKVPSRSSTSSDVQSEVCVDLPDYSELPSAQDRPPGDRGEGPGQVQGRGKLALSFPSAPFKRLSETGRRGGRGRRAVACLSSLSTTAVLLVSLVLFLPVLTLVLILVPICLFLKWLCSLCCCCGPLWGRCCIGCCHAHLTAPERLWVQKGAGGGGGRLTPVAQCVIVLQRGLSTERLRHLLDARLLSLENRHGRRVYPRFRQRVEEFCCGYAWVSDHHFVLHNHVFNMPGYIESLEDLQVSQQREKEKERERERERQTDRQTDRQSLSVCLSVAVLCHN